MPNLMAGDVVTLQVSGQDRSGKPYTNTIKATVVRVYDDAIEAIPDYWKASGVTQGFPLSAIVNN